MDNNPAIVFRVVFRDVLEGDFLGRHRVRARGCERIILPLLALVHEFGDDAPRISKRY